MEEATGSRYPGARPFEDTTIDRIIFRGREKEKARLIQLILAEKLVVLHAKSGMGKTSLLNAGVFEPLRLKGYFPFVVRLNDQQKSPIQLIYEEIEGAATRQGLEFESGDKGTLWQYFKTTEFWSKKDVLYTPVLVFDQFEEIFTLGFSEDQKKQFFMQLADLVRGTIPESLKRLWQISEESPYSEKPPNIKIIISMREDFLGDLEELADDIPTILRNRFRLTPLTQEQAKRAIEEPADLKNKQLQSRRFSYTKRAIDTMIKFLSERRKGKEIVQTDEIELFQLQVLCQHIEKRVVPKIQKQRKKILQVLYQYIERRIKKKKPRYEIKVRPEDFGGWSGMQKIWRNFYNRQLEQFTFWKRRAVRKLCEKGLISPTGRRLSLEAEMIKKKFRVSTDILSQLIASRLLRVEPRLNGFYYELSHDNLVQPIKRSSRHRKVKVGIERGFLVIALLALILVRIVQQSSPQRAVDLVLKNIESREYDRAVADYQRLVKNYPEFAYIYQTFDVADTAKVETVEKIAAITYEKLGKKSSDNKK